MAQVVVGNIDVKAMETSVAQLSYGKYVASITQTSTNAPGEKVMFDSLGEPVWSRVSDGVYRLTLSEAFITNETWIIANQNDGPDFYIKSVWIDEDTIEFTYYSSGVATDGITNPAYIEIRVYYPI